MAKFFNKIKTRDSLKRLLDFLSIPYRNTYLLYVIISTLSGSHMLKANISEFPIISWNILERCAD